MPKDNRGGVRKPGPGKKLGRPKLGKIKRSFSLSRESIEILDSLPQKGFSKSDMVDMLIQNLATAKLIDHVDYAKLIINFRNERPDGRAKHYLFDKDIREVWIKNR